MDKKIYDVIIIGSGLGGLSAAALLAKRGLSVLVLEQFNRIGGFGQSYSLDGYVFDIAVHAIWFWDEIEKFLDELDIHLDVVPARRKDRILFKEGYEYFCTNIPDMKRQISEIVPEAKDEVAEYYDNLLVAQKALVDIDNDPMNFQCRLEFARHRQLWKKTLEEAVNDTVTNPLARSLIFGYHDSYLFDYGWHYPAYHLYCTKYLYDGFLPVGGSQPLVDALEQCILNNGGKILVSTTVKKIIVEQNRAQGVITDDGNVFLAKKAVISNADAILTLEQMVGREKLSKQSIEELDKWKKNVPSLSYYILNVGLDIDVQKEYGIEGDLTIYYPRTDVMSCFKEIDKGCLPDDFWLWMIFPSVNDKTLAPEGGSVAIFSVLVPYNCEQYSHVSKDYQFDGFRPLGNKGNEYVAFKEKLTEKILARAEEVYPGISQHIVVKDMITPLTIERTTLNHKGSTLGVKTTPTPKNIPQKAFDFSIGFRMKTEIEGLYLAGGWTETGFSAPGVIGSGRMVAQEILEEPLEGITIDSNHRMEKLL